MSGLRILYSKFFFQFILTQLLLLVACSFQSDEMQAEKLRHLYKEKSAVQSGDWLYTHEEKYIPLEEYKKSSPIRPNAQRNKIYVYRLGEFSAKEDSLVKIVQEYLSYVFHLRTSAGPSYPFSCVPDSCKRDWGSTAQIKTHFVLDKMVNDSIPADAAVATCFTPYDLYPNDDYNFVFGQAYLHQRVGIWSFYRYGDADNAADAKQLLRRTLCVALHETGHMFSITHCVKYECVMNGSNSLTEGDSRPMFMCPDCLQKLSWNIGFNLKLHFEGLRNFYKKHGFNAEAEFAQKNWELL
jgi:archaemetzincin